MTLCIKSFYLNHNIKFNISNIKIKQNVSNIPLSEFNSVNNSCKKSENGGLGGGGIIIVFSKVLVTKDMLDYKLFRLL